MHETAGSTRWSRDRIVQVLCRTVLFGGLSPAEVERVAELTVPLQCSSGQVLYVIGEEPRGIYVVAEGSVRSVRQTADGREQVLSVEYPGCVTAEVAVFDHGPCFSTAIVHGATSLLFLDRSDMYRLCAECPALFSRTVEVLARRVRAYADLVHTLSLREVDRRVAWFLLEEALRRGVQTDSGVALELTSTHQEIACRLGCVREMVTRAFKHLQLEGLLNVRGRLVTITDHGRLVAYANLSGDGGPPGVRPRSTSV